MCESCGAAIPAGPDETAIIAGGDDPVRDLVMRTYEQYPDLAEQDALLRRVWEEDPELCDKPDLEPFTFDSEDELRDLLTRAAQRWPDLSVRELLRSAREDPDHLRRNTVIDILAHASRRWGSGEGNQAGTADRAT